MNDLQTYRQIFNIIDKDADGLVSAYELHDALQLLEIDIPIETIGGMIDIVDKDRDGHLNLSEFIHFLYICENALPNSYASVLFLAMDQDCMFVIGTQKFQILMQKIGVPLEDNQVDSIFKQYGKDGKLGYDNFIKIIQEFEKKRQQNE